MNAAPPPPPSSATALPPPPQPGSAAAPLPPPPAPKKPWYLRWWVWLVAAVVVIGGIANLVSPGGDDASSAPPAATVATIEVPDVVGQPADTAQSTLLAAGLVVTLDAGDETVLAASNWIVDSQSLESGSAVDRGTQIILAVSRHQTAQTQAPTGDEIAAHLAQSLGEESLDAACINGIGWACNIEELVPHGTAQLEVVIRALEPGVAGEGVARAFYNFLTLVDSPMPDLSFVQITTPSQGEVGRFRG